MSYHGRQVIAWIDQGEQEVRSWARYEDRFTPLERKRLRNGDYTSIRRPLPPRFSEGQWVNVTRNLDIQIDKVELRRGVYRVRIRLVRDWRPPHSESVRASRTSESIAGATTLVAIANRMGEPERMDPPAQVSRLRRAEDIRDAIRAA